MKKIRISILTTIATIILLSCNGSKQETMDNRMQEFIGKFESKVIPLYKNMTLTSWNANISGRSEDYAKSERAAFEYARVFTDTAAFAELKQIKDSKALKDSLLIRQLELLYNAYLGGQVDTTMIAQQIKMETDISKKFSTFRTTLNGKEIPDNEVENILRNSVNNKELQDAWEGSKMIGPVVSDDIIILVKHRNKIARKTGFKNYHDMSLRLSGQDPEEVTAILDELDTLTRNNFARLKGEIDKYLSARYKVKKLEPWHYQNRYFQEAPEIYKVDFDKYYKNQDPIKLASQFYSGIGLDADTVLARSDLYEKPGKNQHAFCTDIDRSGDVRVLTNIRSDSYWMNTILHELGHGVYSYYNDRNLPFLLRDAAHTFTTEAIANFFGRLATDPQWMYSMGIMDEKESMAISDESKKALRLQMLVFSRWVQVMYRFEKSMYEDPGQDLNALWWKIAGQYQLVKKPTGRNKPDWATKIHIALYPCYYHNYLLGELLASQLHNYILTNITDNTSLVGEKKAGDYLREKIFLPGARYQWNDMIRRATGEKLTAKYYAIQFVE